MARSAQTSAKTRPPFMFFSPKRGRILSGQGVESALGHVVEAADAGDLAVLHPVLPAVVVDQRLRLLAVNLEALPYRRLLVVVALHQRFAGGVVAAVLLRRIELDLVSAARGWLYPPAAHAHDDL